MSLQLTTISHPTSDITHSSVMIMTSNTGTRNLVGSVPEGLQRRCNEMGTRISRLQNIFMSGILDWSRIGGLPGMILTIADQGVKDLGICHSGNKNILKYMISNWRFFVFRFGINLTVHDELPVREPYKCDGFSMIPINIAPSSLSETPKKGPFLQKEEEKLKSVTHSNLSKMIDLIFPKPDVNSSNPPAPNKYICNVELPSTVKNQKISICWIMQGDVIRGRFLPQKAKQLGCKVEHFKILCSGKSVTLDDGTVVLPQDVLEPNRMFAPVLFLDIPSKDHLGPVLEYNWMEELERVNGADGVKRYGVVYHFIGDDMYLLLDDPKYVEFIKSFGEETIHFFGSKEYVPNTLNYVTSFRESFKWSYLLPDMFPLQKFSNEEERKIPQELAEKYHVKPLTSGQHITLNAGITDFASINQALKVDKPVDEQYFYDIFEEEMKPLNFTNSITETELHKNMDQRNEKLYLNREIDKTKPLKDQVECTALGTGSAIPSRFRNVMGNLLRIPTNNGKKWMSVVLDAGENTLGSIERLFHKRDVKLIFEELELIYLSHLHADHHMGIAGLISKWCRVQIKLPKSQRKCLRCWLVD
ncbi:unnamed protein product [Ambrosiozyma monospora]|uniref:Unnamed protein product n=1 Tax=Ambrosiozyma monospora TaxID=43982 RepID=A0ACB5T6S3_AMBMO|nr:unnamed protein product [Ambrosiozyma monospora]